VAHPNQFFGKPRNNTLSPSVEDGRNALIKG
jgi:hypothetical protein